MVQKAKMTKNSNQGGPAFHEQTLKAYFYFCQVLPSGQIINSSSGGGSQVGGHQAGEAADDILRGLTRFRPDDEDGPDASWLDYLQ